MAKSSWSHALAWVSLAGALAGCSTIPDHPHSANPPPISSADTSADSDEPIPKVESPSRSGNPDTYVVFGRRYRVQETSEGYREEGTASWYGWEFHGRKTSSGPLFNMFELTAAHKSLPLPTYVQVTNLENGRQIVVKVTDRGPFVGERAIDLSYAAADRLGMLEQGTARVEIVALAPFQFLPKLAARRAEQRELLASRQNRPEPVIKPAVIQFARATPARPSAQAPGKPPAQVLAQIEREKARKAQARASLLLAQANVDRSAPKATTRKVAGARSGVKSVASVQSPARPAALRLASATPAPTSKGKATAANRPAPVATASKNSKPDVTQKIAGRNAIRQERNAVAIKTDKPVATSGGGNRPPSRNASPSQQTTLRLAGLRTNRSRIVAD